MKRGHLCVPGHLVTEALLVLALMVLALIVAVPQGAQAQETVTDSNAAAIRYRTYLPHAAAAPPWPPPVMVQRLNSAAARYPHIAGTGTASCILCHRTQPVYTGDTTSDYNLNNYGSDYRGASYDFASIERYDSDGDSYRNIDELSAGSNPGDKASVPGGSTQPPAPAQPNLVDNPGFESWGGNAPSGWTYSGGGSLTWDSNAHSGSHALRINGQSGSNVVLESNFFRVQPDQVVDASAWFKWQSISGGGGLRMDMYVYDSNQAKIKSWFFASVDGTASTWRHISSFALMPANAAYVRIRIHINAASGTAWVDDVYGRIAQKIPGVDTSVAGPVIMPHPWQTRSNGTWVGIGNAAIVVPNGENRLRTAADTAWDSVGSHTMLAAGDSSAANYATLVRFGDRNTPDVAAAFQAKFGGNNWDQLGSQGYFLTVQKPGSQVQVLIGANSEQGRFYGLQSVRQIIKSGQIYTLDVLDVPTIGTRGIIMSASRFGNYTANLQKIAGYKMNFSWNQGQFMSNKFNYEWRTALSSGEQSELRDYIQQAANNFVTPWISIGPRASSAGGDTTCYSCDADINLVVNKFNVLYGLGLRNFGLNFDDLNNVGQESLDRQQDISRFGGDAAQAHLYFINTVYDRFRAMHSDFNMMIVPFRCYLAGTFGASGDHYLQVMAGLRPQIGIYSVQYYNEDYVRQMQLTGRATVNWSNFYAEGWAPNGTYVAPHYNFFDAANASVRNAMVGLTFLPIQPGDEDTAGISWTTTADYFWAPDRYNPDQAFQWGAAKYQGK